MPTRGARPVAFWPSAFNGVSVRTNTHRQAIKPLQQYNGVIYTNTGFHTEPLHTGVKPTRTYDLLYDPANDSHSDP